MSIVIGPSGMAGAYGAAGIAAGQGEAAKEKNAQAAELQARQQQQNFQALQQSAELEAHARSQAWEMEKMEYESRQQFARENIQSNAELKRAQLISDLEVQRDAKKHAETFADLDSADKAIDEWAAKNGMDQTPEDKAAIAKMKVEQRVRALTKNPDSGKILFPEMFDPQVKAAKAKDIERQRKLAAVDADTTLTPAAKSKQKAIIEYGYRQGKDSVLDLIYQGQTNPNASPVTPVGTSTGASASSVMTSQAHADEIWKAFTSNPAHSPASESAFNLGVQLGYWDEQGNRITNYLNRAGVQSTKTPEQPLIPKQSYSSVKEVPTEELKKLYQEASSKFGPMFGPITLTGAGFTNRFAAETYEKELKRRSAM